MTKTYSEQRQAILFKASRELRRVACLVLDEVVEEAELTGSTIDWAKSVAASTAKLANELEGRGHEETIAPPRSNTDLSKSHDEYGAAIDAFEGRIAAARFAANVEAEIASQPSAESLGVDTTKDGWLTEYNAAIAADDPTGHRITL